MDAQCESLLIESVADGSRALGGAEPLVDGPSGLHRGSVDAPVEEEHNKHGQIE